MDARFPRSARVRARAEFDRVFACGRRVSDRLLSLHWQATTGPARLGLAVSRKVDPRAVVRNRLKRALREEFRRLRPALAGGDYVIVVRPAAANLPVPGLRAAFATLLQRAGALPAPAPAGTMPGLPPSPSSPPV